MTAYEKWLSDWLSDYELLLTSGAERASSKMGWKADSLSTLHAVREKIEKRKKKAVEGEPSRFITRDYLQGHEDETDAMLSLIDSMIAKAGK